MKLTPRQRYQIIFVVIAEVQRLAHKFGLIDGLEALQVFNDSIEIKNQEALVTLFEQDNTDTKTERLLNKTSKTNEDRLLRIMGEIFAIKMHSTTANELKQVIDFSEKELKKLSTIASGELDSEVLNDYVKMSIRDYIKLKFGVSRKDIRDARIQLEKRLCAKPEESLSTISSCATVPLLLLQDKKPQNFNYHGIKINGLYKLIKILNGIENKDVARSFLHFFAIDNADNRQIMQTFFAVEKTGQYCRLQTMLVQTLSLLVTHNQDYQTLSERFVSNILKQSETNIERLMETPDSNVIALFNNLFESTLSISTQFNYILAVAKLNLAEREQQINALNSTQDIFLRSVYYFCFVSPLLELIESGLKKQDTWNIQDIQKLRLELSTAFHVMLGMRSGVVKDNSISKPPLLLKLAMNDEMREKVSLSFAAVGAVETSTLIEADSSLIKKSTQPGHSGHQRRRSRTEGESSLLSAKPKPSKPVMEPQCSSSDKRTGATERGGAVDCVSSSSEDYSTRKSKREIYSSFKTMSFYNSDEQTPSSSSSSSIKPGVTESARKRSQSNLSDKKHVTRGVSTSKLPLLSIKKITEKEDDSLELYFNQLFDCDLKTATQFVLSLVRPKDKMKLSWGIRVLNEASGKSSQQIATVLLTHLSEAELLGLFAELFRMEVTDSWCRGNKLLPLLMQHYLAHEDRKEYKKMIWGTVFALSDSLSKIDSSQYESDTFTMERFKADQANIALIQQNFLNALNTILSPKQFPMLIQGIFQLGYADLKRRDESVFSEDALLCKLIAFILIRFINPIISQEAQLLTDPVLKQWYLGTIPAAIQSLTSPLATSVASSAIPTLRDLIFGAITKDMQQRNKIYTMMAAELQVASIVAVPLDRDEPSLIWDNERCKRDLNDMLKQEQFSGLSFKANGTVTPRRDTTKPRVLSFFETALPSGGDSLSRSTTPRREGDPVIEEDADNEISPSSSGSVDSPKVGFSV